MSKTNKTPSTSVQNVEEPKEKDTTEKVSVVTDTKSEEKPNDSVVKNQNTEEKKDENVNTEKVKTPPLSVNTPNDITPPTNTGKSSIKVGDMVMLKPTVKTTVTGTLIPVFAFKNLYKVEKILTDRIIITAGTLKFPVKSTDVDNIKK